MRGRPKRFGECSPIEREIIEEIIFDREVKKKTFQSIADNLNSQSHWPRRAPKWTWLLVRHVWITNLPGNEEKHPL
jgi:hypothetical protein